MPELFFVRHGQARFGADDYDRLSDLGRRQAEMLGEHLRGLGLRFPTVICGGLRRHRETAEAMGLAVGRVDQRLDEYDAEAILAAWLADRPAPKGVDTDRRVHFRTLREALLDWSEDRVPGVQSYAAFRDGVADALREAAVTEGPVLISSSGGPLSMAMRFVLGCDAATAIGLNLQAKNTGYTRIIAGGSGFYLKTFNETPHLDPPERADMLTYS